ncbi:MAG: ATP--guanido phosphotransferase, partial [Phycisphaerae bacterium]
MTLDDLLQTTGEWLRGVGPLSDVVMSSRVRLARNLSDYPFLGTAGVTERTEVYRCITGAITSTSVGQDALLIDVDAADPIDREILVERHLMSRQHLGGEGSRGVTLSPDETRSLMINEEDHLRIQGLRSGLQLEAAWEDVNAIDDALGQQLSFAFDGRFG